MDIKSVLGGVSLVLILALGFVFWLYIGSKEEVARLESKLALSEANTRELEESLQKQNAALEALRVKASEPPKEIAVIREIKIEDSSCEAELQGYKKLFKELGK